MDLSDTDTWYRRPKYRSTIPIPIVSPNPDFDDFELHVQDGYPFGGVLTGYLSSELDPRDNAVSKLHENIAGMASFNYLCLVT